MINNSARQFRQGRAVTLAERLTVFSHQFKDCWQQHDRSLGQRRLAQWQGQSPFTQAELFSDRLRLAGISEEQFAWHLGISQPELGHEKQAWQTNLQTIWQQYDPDRAAIALPELLLQRYPGACFLQAFQPFLQFAHCTLEQEISSLRQKYGVVPFSDDVVEQALFRNVPPQLIYSISRTAVLELNIARLREQLPGETAEARFNDFIDILSRPDHLGDFLDEYPVLARLITVLTTQWVAAFTEFLDHLCHDWRALQATFGVGRVLEDVSMSAGDRHRHGRTVSLARFSSGLRLVYKPRGLSVDVHFQQLLTWLNGKGIAAPFRTLTILDRGDHGWVEFVEAQACDSQDQVKNFYWRQGAFLALLHALSATDFHHENLIAAGEHPVLVDLETLFSPSYHGKEVDLPVSVQMMADSVMSIGLLPQRIWTGEEQEGVDLSGMGMKGDQLAPHGVPTWNQAETDEMHFTRQRLRIAGKTHQPTLCGAEVQLIDYLDEICSGFRNLYELLVRQRKELADFLYRFKADRVRYVARATHTYTLILTESVHPDLMQDALARDQLFDNLWNGAADNKALRRLIAYEQEDMWRYDVPFFTTYPDSVDLWSSEGGCIEGYFDESGLARVVKKLARLGPTDLDRQLWLIQASLATVSHAAHQPARQIGLATLTPANEFNVSPDQLIRLAVRAGERIEALALAIEEDPAWFAINLNTAGNYLTVDPINIELYNGLSGVALFFAYLAKCTENSSYRVLAQRISEKIRQALQTFIAGDDLSSLPVGGFEGGGGIVYALTHLSSLWNDPDLLADAITLTHSLAQGISKDQTYDIISGSAGCIGALLTLAAVTRDDSVLKVARHCGDHLLANRIATEHGPAWMPAKSLVVKEPLTGFSHGVAGIAWALLKLAEATGEDKYAAAARQSLAYERAFFSVERQNWRDLRVLSTPPELSAGAAKCATLWCHGAPGVGLGRLDTLHLLDDATVREEIDIAIHTTLRDGFGQGHSLCHGDLGNMELLLQARARLGAHWDADIKRLTGRIVASIEEHGWLCGNSLYVEVPGLMTGLAGIGYGLLRLAFPDATPALLLFAPPGAKP
jgi:type 2 lantibiotic biosynthesis protein LanM